MDVAVATTYSLDLTSMLLAPMSFALHDYDSGELDRLDPIKLLESVRRHSDHTTVFCQAGAIHLPSSYRTVLTFAEESVHEVLAPTARRVFHPKVWVVRFVDPQGQVTHRFLCLSRNLTFDRSWDTLLRLDETENDAAGNMPDPAELAEFLSALPSLATRPLSVERQGQLDDLVRTVRSARFAVPDGFDSLEFLFLGVGGRVMPSLGQGDRLLAVSAFLDATTVRTLSQIAPEGTLVSRPESLDRVGTDSVGSLSCYVLQRPAEVEVGSDTEEPVCAVQETDPVPEGLHAKTFVVDHADRSRVITGSANATSAGFTGNVEFSVLLEGPRSLCGVSSMWDGTKEAPGLSRMVQSHALPADHGTPDARERTAWEIDMFHAELSQGGLELTIEPDGDRFHLRLCGPDLASPGRTTVWPISLPSDTYAAELVGAEPVRWGPLGVRSITPFIAVQTTAGVGDERCSHATVIKATLVGDSPDRRREAMRDVLRTKEDVLRYLAFLLGDPAYEQWFGAGDGSDGDAFHGLLPGQRHDLVIFEPLIRAAARGDASIGRVANLLTEITGPGSTDDLVPEGFRDIWEAVWAAVREEGANERRPATGRRTGDQPAEGLPAHDSRTRLPPAVDRT